MRAERKSPQTVRVYTGSLQGFIAWCARDSREPALNRDNVRDFIVALSDNGASAATCNVRHRALHRFGAWLAEEGELEHNPLAGMTPPKRDRKVVPKISDDECRALLKAVNILVREARATPSTYTRTTRQCLVVFQAT